MKFSIIVPVYNAEKYLEECINSILKQNYSSFELILINDGSSDSSAKICDNFANDDSRINVIHKNNKGVTSARKAGACVANGEYIMCIDSDDYISPNYLQQVNDTLEQSPVDVLCVNYKIDGKKDNKCFCNLGLYQGEQLLEKYMMDFDRNLPNSGNLPYSVWTKIVRRDIFVMNQMQIDDEIVMGEDLILSSKILKSAKSVLISDISGYCYRTNFESVTLRYNPNKLYQYSNLCSALCGEFHNYPNKVNCLALFALLDFFSAVAKNSNTYRGYLQKLNELDYGRSLEKFSRNAIVKKCNLKTKVKIVLLKMNLYRLMYYLYR